MIVKVTSTAIGGILVMTVGVGALIIFNGISFIISAVSEMFISVPATPKQSDNAVISPALLLAEQFSLRYVGAIGLALAVLPTVLLFAHHEVRRALSCDLLQANP